MSSPYSDNPEFQADLRGIMSSNKIAAKHGISRSAVQRWRKRIKHAATAITAGGESEKHNPDGSADYVRFSEKPWGFDDYCAFIASQGQNPDEVTFTWGWTSNPVGGFWNKLNNVRPIIATVETEAPIVFQSILNDIRGFTYIHEPVAYDATTAIIMPADLQVGKVDWNGGSKETVEQALNCCAHR